MAIINGPSSIDINKILESSELFCEKNRMNKDETKEIQFLCRAFCKFYNSMSNKTAIYSPKMIAEAFDEMIKSTLLVDDWSGLTTHADLFVKEIPAIKELLEQDSLDKMLSDKEKAEETLKTKKRTTQRSTISSRSYGACGGGYNYGPSC